MWLESLKKMKKISELPACPVETALVLMGDRWKMLIVRDLLERTMRMLYPMFLGR